MEQVSMKSVRKDLETKFGMSLSDRKEEIKGFVTEFLESR
jgi:protein DEK